MNVGKVLRCSRYVNVDLMDATLNGELLEEVDCQSTYGRKWQRIEGVQGL